VSDFEPVTRVESEAGALRLPNVDTDCSGFRASECANLGHAGIGVGSLSV